MGENSVSSGSSQSAAAASASSAQNIQNPQQSQSLDSVVAKLADSAVIKPAEIKPYPLSANLVESEKQSNSYKKDAKETSEIKQESKKGKAIEADLFSSSKIFYGTAAPVNKDERRPINAGNSAELRIALFRGNLLSKAFDLGILKSFAYFMKEALFGSITTKIYAPA